MATSRPCGKQDFAAFPPLARGRVSSARSTSWAPLIVAAPKEAQRILERLRGWGIGRFSVAWRAPNRQALFEHLDAWGYDVNIYDIPDLESFLRAALMLPRSLTADFNFPGVAVLRSLARGRNAPITTTNYAGRTAGRGTETRHLLT